MRRAPSVHEVEPNDRSEGRGVEFRLATRLRRHLCKVIVFVMMARVAVFSSRSALAQVRPPEVGWLSLSVSAFAQRSPVGWTQGALFTVAIPFDRFARSSSREGASWGILRTASAYRTAVADGAAPSNDAAIERGPPLAGPRVARLAVLAALRAAALGVDDRALASIVARARLSALLPEARLRATRSANDELTFDAATESSRLSGDGGRTLWLEARLTWRLDRLLFVDEELGVERLRLERNDVRTKLAIKVVDGLSKWERAAWDAETSEAGSRERGEAVLALEESMLVLDVLTGGWFATWAASLPNVAGAVARVGR